MEIPVYMFSGFLEGGKTTFIQGTLEDERFDDNGTTLLLVCEEGLEEYDTDKFKVKNVVVETIEDEVNLTNDVLLNFQKKHKMTRVIVEFNGMWNESNFINEMPEDWIIYQEMTFIKATDFVIFNKNMRQQMVDKLQGTNLLVLNRANDTIDKEEVHKIVRGVSRSADIVYEYADGHTEYDEIEDPLPFDIEADVIEIKDEDYAIWYRDLSEDMDKYIGKTVKFKGIIAHDDKFPKNTVVIGRHVMVCCEADITYRGLVCLGTVVNGLKKRDWVIVTGKIAKDYHEMYEGEGPILNATEIKMSKEPENQVATFY